ncbi:MAG TPA: sulfatase [Thermoanaerobaculia bacterium]|nr:sulfatase [Thermoanaerobaculia bacterium]
MRTLRFLLALCLGIGGIGGIAGCSRPAAHPTGAWQRTDLWIAPPQVELWTRPTRPFSKRISFLGAAEVRDMSKVPPQQLIAFPTRTAGQVRAVEQQPGSRLKWHLRLPRDPYFSFVPLGSETPCACTYRMGVRASGRIEELYKVPVLPVGPIAKATAEVDLSPWAGQEVDLLLQIDGPPPALPGAPVPAALWGSPAVYGRGAPARQRRAHPTRPNVLFIGIDTLRADAVGAFRQPSRATSLTPSIDRLAAASDVYLNAYTAFNVTNPSFISMMTGLYGKRHGVYDLKTPLPPGHATLADLFSRAGYDTMAIISARHLGDHNSGLGHGFKDVTEPSEHFAAELAADMAMDWIAGHASRPFFAWVHLFDPHTPHTPPDPFALGLRPAADEGLNMVPAWVVFRPPGPRPFTEAVLGGNTDLYYGEVAYTDRQVGRLLDFLDSRALSEDTIVVVVADHGENLGEHGILYRHVGLFETTTHVPMLIRWPGDPGDRKGHRIAGLVQTIDLFPTLLRAAGLPVPASDGVDLRRLTSGGRRAVFSEHAEKLGVSVRSATHRYMLSQGNARFYPDGPYLFDEAADPAETVNLIGKGLPVERELDGLLRRWLADRGTGGAGASPRQRHLSDEETRRLKSLGYN